MQKLKNSIICLFLLAGISTRAQQSELIKNYIEKYKDIAMAEMLRTGVPASIKLAQGIFETTAGTSPLVLRSSNHFGIKCKSNWTGESVRHDDDLKAECFRKYPTDLDSYRDHSDFLKTNPRYAGLFVLDPLDYKGWAMGLKKAGYATNSKYPQALIRMIEDYDLQSYSYLALGKDHKKNDTEHIVITEKSNDDNTTTKNSGPVMSEVVALPVYPEGEFKLNETKLVFIKKGTSYLSVAREYNIDLAKLFDFNEMPVAEEAGYDQLVYLQRKRKTGYKEFHIVRPGETLHSIARDEAIRVESLMELNWLKDGDIPVPGEQLNLQKRSVSIPKLAVKENYSLIPAARKQGSH